jgi:hypothetical protein
MVRAAQTVCLLVVAIAMGLALAHALELPGKMRLDKATYLTVQRIYYPGFTIGGAAEPLGILALALLLVFAPPPGARFWWTAAALGCLVAMQAVYWLLTHPANSAWTKDLQLTGLGATFFALLAPETTGDWWRLRDIWEYSHLARAVLGMLGLICLALGLMA